MRITPPLGPSAVLVAALAGVCAIAAFAGASGPHASLPSTPEFGVNIHFTKQVPGELDMIRRAGFRWVRMDFFWGAVERARGVYDFSAYDALSADLQRSGLKALFILDYGNPLYDGGDAPHTEQGRAAFAKWAAACVRRFAGKGYVWEIWNEPNIQFWKPRPDATNYAALALSACRAIRAAAPDEAIVGPATSEIDMKFLEACFQAGLLSYWDAVSVHPYRQGEPAGVTNEYAKLRASIARCAPAGRGASIPVLAGEWGYSAAWRGCDEARQAERLRQEFTVNRSEGVPITIWYDWRDDGNDPANAEHRFGLVRRAPTGNPAQPYDPKPAFEAAHTYLGGTP